MRRIQRSQVEKEVAAKKTPGAEKSQREQSGQETNGHVEAEATRHKAVEEKSAESFNPQITSLKHLQILSLMLSCTAF